MIITGVKKKKGSRENLRIHDISRRWVGLQKVAITYCKLSSIILSLFTYIVHEIPVAYSRTKIHVMTH